MSVFVGMELEHILSSSTCVSQRLKLTLKPSRQSSATTNQATFEKLKGTFVKAFKQSHLHHECMHACILRYHEQTTFSDSTLNVSS